MKFRLIIITAPGAGNDELQVISALFAGKLETLHVRKPGYSKAQLRQFLQQLPQKYHKRVVIHAHYSLLSQFKLKGIHLTAHSRRKRLPGAFDPARHTLSGSFHSLAEIARAKRTFDYVFLSPVFDSISKKGYRSAFDREELSAFLEKHQNIVALGGVDLKNIRQIIKMGFAGAATLGFIWESKDPVKTYFQLRSKIKQSVA